MDLPFHMKSEFDWNVLLLQSIPPPASAPLRCSATFLHICYLQWNISHSSPPLPWGYGANEKRFLQYDKKKPKLNIILWRLHILSFHIQIREISGRIKCIVYITWLDWMGSLSYSQPHLNTYTHTPLFDEEKKNEALWISKHARFIVRIQSVQ